MEITLTIKGESPAEVREALLKLYNEGVPGPVAEPQPIEESQEDQVRTALEAQVPEGKKRHIYRMRRKCHQWKTDEEALVMDLYEKGVSAAAIADALQGKFGFRVSAQAVKQRVQKNVYRG